LTEENAVNCQGVVSIKLDIFNLILMSRKSTHLKTSINKQSPNHEAHQHSKTTDNIIEAHLLKYVKAVAIYFITIQFCSGKIQTWFFSLQNCILKNTAIKTARF